MNRLLFQFNTNEYIVFIRKFLRLEVRIVIGEVTIKRTWWFPGIRSIAEIELWLSSSFKNLHLTSPLVQWFSKGK